MKSLSLLSLPFLLLLTANSYAQRLKNHQSLHNAVNLFEYGDLIKTPEDNLINFFNNFPKLITTSDIKLFSYNKVGIATNCKNVKSFLRKNKKLTKFSPNIFLRMDSTSLSTSQIRLSLINSITKNVDKETSNEYLKVTEQLCLNVPLEVYKIKLLYSINNTYDYYVFVDPTSNKIQLSGNFFGFNIPAFYADYKTGRKSDTK